MAAVRTRESLLPLLRAAHAGPSVAVTVITALLCAAAGLSPGRSLIVTLAVLTGQLTIGWGNDLVDAGRDRRAARSDKPLATGALDPGLVQRSLVLALAACVALSLLAGWRGGLTHLVLLVGFGHLYNLRLKATTWSWLPYAVAFGSLPAVVWLAQSPPQWPPVWMVVTASALGVAAHFLNVLPDLDDDAATGVRGLPHRLGPTWSRGVATGLLGYASAVAVVGPPGSPAVLAWMTLVAVAALAVVAMVGRGKLPFYAAVAIALLDVALLTLAPA